jgi:hypothetical protein
MDNVNQTFENFMNEIPDDYIGDEPSDNDVHKIVLNYIHRMVLLDMIYKETYYNRIDGNITEQILSFL